MVLRTELVSCNPPYTHALFHGHALDAFSTWLPDEFVNLKSETNMKGVSQNPFGQQSRIKKTVLDRPGLTSAIEQGQAGVFSKRWREDHAGNASL